MTENSHVLVKNDDKREEILAKTVKKEEKGGNVMENEQKNDKSGVIMDITDETRTKIRKLNKKPSKKPVKQTKTEEKVNKTITKGGDNMKSRNDIEKLLRSVAKAEGCAIKEIAPKSISKSGKGALQALHKKDGRVMIAVRDHDIIAYMPYDELGYGVLAAVGYPHVARLRPGVDDMEKAFRKALRSKLTNSEWAKKCNFAPRKPVVSAKIAQVEKEKEAATKQLKKVRVRKANKAVKKVSKIVGEAIAKVATETA